MIVVMFDSRAIQSNHLVSVDFDRRNHPFFLEENVHFQRKMYVVHFLSTTFDQDPYDSYSLDYPSRNCTIDQSLQSCLVMLEPV